MQLEIPIDPDDDTKRALDQLFHEARRYRSSQEYWELLEFVTRFHAYSPFNAMLSHVQMPGATFVAPAGRWNRDYGRSIKPAARPIVILQPMGQVMFVFDVSDTEPMEGAAPLFRRGYGPVCDYRWGRSTGAGVNGRERLPRWCRGGRTEGGLAERGKERAVDPNGRYLLGAEAAT